MSSAIGRLLATTSASVKVARSLPASQQTNAQSSRSRLYSPTAVNLQDCCLLVAACTATLSVFGVGAASLGFYSDDAGFLITLPGQDLAHTLQSAAAYVPGRNLHIIWQQLLFLAAGSSPADLGKLHLAQAGMDALAVGLLYVLARQLGLPPVWSLASSAIFAFYPNHGETHYWLSSAPMNLLSTIFVIGYIITAIREARKNAGKSRSVGWAVAAFLLFVAALFTYDQTFFVLVAVLAVRVLLFLLTRRYWRSLAMSLLYGSVILFYGSLKMNPASGPTLTNVSLSHIVETFIASYSVTFGYVFRVSLQAAVDAASPNDRIAAGVVGALFVATCLAATLVELRLGPGLRRGVASARASGRLSLYHPPLTHLAVLLMALVGAVLAYGPAYLWYIESRHNFLPTAGVALAAGAAGAFAASLARRYIHRVVASAFVVASTAVIGVGLFAFVAGNLSEKTFWTDSYQLRSRMYSDLAQSTDLAGKTAIVFEKFPNSLGPAHFFGLENNLALDYLYPPQAALTLSGFGSISTPQAYFIDTELDRFGIAARYVPRSQVVHLRYDGQTGDHLLVTTGGDEYRAEDLYSVNLAPGSEVASGSSQPIQSATLRVTPGAGSMVALELDLRSVEVPANAELGLIFKSRVDQTDVPIFVKSSSGERMIVPVALMSATDASTQKGSVEAVVDLRQLASTDLDKVGLYVFGDNPPRLLEEVPIVRASTS